MTKAITFNSPHGGVYGIDALGCADCQQAQDLVYNSAFMSDLSRRSWARPTTNTGLSDYLVISLVAGMWDNIVGGLLRS